MPDDHPELAPVRRLDPAHLVALVNEHTDAGLTLLGPAPGGEVGAAFVRWPDGRDGVLTMGPGSSADVLRTTAEILATARAQGLPVPAYDLIAEVPDAVAIVQERLPGSPPARVDRAVVEAMVELNERFAGLLADRPDVEPPDLYLRHSGPGFCLHEPLARYDDRTRRLLAWIREVGVGDGARMTGDDLVHLDFNVGNVLVDGAGGISGIVDWDGIGRGDRRFGLVTLRFDVASRNGDPDTARWLDDVLDRTIEPETLRLYWAAMSLRMVDWMIRHYSAAEVDLMLDFARTRADY
ncbi:Ser/Thr protein kinase RdoA involved in Cpx stress response, MazF antagonist [Actinopolymorpha cephalotaxi]|uniref:Aminoglycoside phosphotransferase (APT) family kinase protein n=1 Tax=Actinopolymorpha cephalotaxi TaxID=504797 RepID=A0A1I2RCQ4_9ACTN|nr:aminoglycoside phosphotransferase family protein [Actinopolymorpha cephalotaxi]NYH82273.1 aminoglycoside phosphotransferase (APT) family kinase protein [Actinopolymorpha cephalotaxi]SFG38318.1 Ser/Thr protein kinase RdoA involved in Cpx stress response, MazF antagonist [Actinopolymorpha cephalotaxi]